MTSTAPTRTISFSLPEGVLRLPIGELDGWAEHLTGCLRFLGVESGATVGILDFGASPVAYLSSRMITAGLARGYAERLPATVICLDASRERVALAPSIMAQLPLDVVIVRHDVRPLLETVCRNLEVPLDQLLVLETVGLGARGSKGGATRAKRLLVDEVSLLMAPECATCGAFHVSPERYDVDPASGRVTARDSAADGARLPAHVLLEPGSCEREPAHWRIGSSS